MTKSLEAVLFVRKSSLKFNKIMIKRQTKRTQNKQHEKHTEKQQQQQQTKKTIKKNKKKKQQPLNKTKKSIRIFSSSFKSKRRENDRVSFVQHKWKYYREHYICSANKNMLL